jgi:hypothetical protein
VEESAPVSVEVVRVLLEEVGRFAHLQLTLHQQVHQLRTITLLVHAAVLALAHQLHTDDYLCQLFVLQLSLKLVTISKAGMPFILSTFLASLLLKATSSQ